MATEKMSTTAINLCTFALNSFNKKINKSRTALDCKKKKSVFFPFVLNNCFCFVNKTSSTHTYIRTHTYVQRRKDAMILGGVKESAPVVCEQTITIIITFKATQLGSVFVFRFGVHSAVNVLNTLLKVSGKGLVSVDGTLELSLWFLGFEKDRCSLCMSCLSPTVVKGGFSFIHTVHSHSRVCFMCFI